MAEYGTQIVHSRYKGTTRIAAEMYAKTGPDPKRTYVREESCRIYKKISRATLLRYLSRAQEPHPSRLLSKTVTEEGPWGVNGGEPSGSPSFTVYHPATYAV